MNRTEMIDALADQFELSRRQANEVVNAQTGPLELHPRAYVPLRRIGDWPPAATMSSMGIRATIPSTAPAAMTRSTQAMTPSAPPSTGR